MGSWQADERLPTDSATALDEERKDVPGVFVVANDENDDERFASNNRKWNARLCPTVRVVLFVHSGAERKKSRKKQLQNEKKRQKDQEKAARRKATRKEYQRKVPIEDSQPRMAEEFGTEEEEEEEEEEEDTHEQTITAVTEIIL